jgi:hypothetical protein
MVEEQIKVSLVGEDAGLGAATVTGSKNLDRFGKSIDDVNKKLPQLNRNSGTATQSMANLSKITQDIPSSFAGVASNMAPVLDAFQGLESEAGGTGAILQALAGSLMGPVGISVALGVVSSLFLTFVRNVENAGKETEDAGHKFDFFTDRINDAKNALADVNAEIDHLAKLGSINIKIAGLKESLDLEGQVVSIAEKVAAANDEYRKQSDIISDIESKLNDSDKKGNLINTGKAKEELESQLKAAQDAQRKANEDQIRLDRERTQAEASVRLQKKKEAEDEAKDREDEHKKALDALKKRNKELLEEEKRAAAERKKVMDALRTGSVAFSSPTDFFKDLNKEESLKSNPDFEKFLKNQFSDIKVPVRINIVPATTPLINAKDLKIIDKLAIATNVNQAINDALAQIEIAGFVALGDAIGKAISGGNIGDVFSGFAAQLGSVITQLGEQLIKFGVLAQLAQKSIASALTNPFALIAAGVALTAFGSAFQSAIQVPHLANGGIIPAGYSGDKFPAMLSSGEAVIPLDKIHNYLGNTGGSGPQVIVMAQRLRGRDSILQQSRENRSQRRGV